MAQKTTADFQIAFSACRLRDETPPPPAWQGDLSPIFYGPFNPPKINGVSAEFPIMAQKTIADFQIGFSASSLRVETRGTRLPSTRAARRNILSQNCAHKVCARNLRQEFLECFARAFCASILREFIGKSALTPLILGGLNGP